MPAATSLFLVSETAKMKPAQVCLHEIAASSDSSVDIAYSK